MDAATKYAEIDCIARKSEALTCIKVFKIRAEKAFGKKLKAFRTDWGTEYENTQFHNFCKEYGIDYQYSATYAHE